MIFKTFDSDINKWTSKNEVIKAQTFSAKAGAVALKALSK